jgi:hypothetical protein
MLRFILFFTFVILILSCGTHKSIPTPKATIDSCKVDLDTCPVYNEVEEIRVDAIKREKIEKIETPDLSENDLKPLKGKPSVNLEKTKSLPKKTPNSENGQLLYSMEDTMSVGISYRVVVRILNSKNESSISEGLEVVSRVESIRTSSTMQVEMIDPHKAFSITASNNSQIQIVDSIEYTEWIFNVMPLESGRHPLSIVSSIITENGKKDRTYSNTVFVKMNIIRQTEDFWESEWKWLFTTLIIPLIIWWYKNRKKSDAS